MERVLTLVGLTRKAKNRIIEHGNKWRQITPWTSHWKEDGVFIESLSTGNRRWLTDEFVIEAEGFRKTKRDH